MTTIAFIGLGNMGGPMAAHLIAPFDRVRVFDLSKNAVAELVDKGARPAGSVEEAVADADVVVTMLPAGPHVAKVYTGADGVMAHARRGALFIDCSTIDVDTARRVAAAAGDRGFAMVDAPVSGGVAAAAAGSLTFMVGGAHDAFLKAREILDPMGKAVIHAGDAGAGQAAKICNNMLLGIHMIGTCEALALAEKLGLDAQSIFDIASVSSGQNWTLTSYCPVPGPVPAAPSNRGYKPGFAAPMMLKDLRLASDAAGSVAASTPLGDHARKLYEAFVDQGGGELDFSAIITMLRSGLPDD